jgi:hypothetical protein
MELFRPLKLNHEGAKSAKEHEGFFDPQRHGGTEMHRGFIELLRLRLFFFS